jgi:hypothetical protein
VNHKQTKRSAILEKPSSAWDFLLGIFGSFVRCPRRDTYLSEQALSLMSNVATFFIFMRYARVPISPNVDARNATSLISHALPRGSPQGQARQSLVSYDTTFHCFSFPFVLYCADTSMSEGPRIRPVHLCLG